MSCGSMSEMIPFRDFLGVELSPSLLPSPVNDDDEDA